MAERSLDSLLDAHRVGVLLTRLALEAAVRARGHADVGQVQVPVDVEVRHVAVELGSAFRMSEAAEPGEVVGFVQVFAVLAG